MAVANAQTETVGVLPGSFAVGSDGAATYSIPIPVASGINGLTPSIALAYSSNSGSGWAGIGWTLTGFRAVTRCNRSLSTDDSIRGVRFAPDPYIGINDRFCLDGQPLMAPSVAYGLAGAEYRKEISDYTKVVSNGSIGGTGQPASFTATDRNGLIYSFGGTDDAKIGSGLPSGAIRLWALDSIEDRFGNKVRFKYGKATDGSGEYWPSEILWTVRGTSEDSARYRLSFAYEARPTSDLRSGWVFGARWASSRRLTAIQYDYRATSGWVSTNTYTLRYRNPVAGGSGRSQLEGVRLCSPTECYPETTIGWHDGVTAFPALSQAIPLGQYAGAQSVRFADIDGDGDQDMFAGSQLFMVQNGSFLPPVTPTTTGGAPVSSVTFEFDGDGKADSYVIASATGPGTVFRSTGDPVGFQLVANGIGSRPVAPNFNVPFPYNPVDINGDGCDELAFVDANGTVMVHMNPCNGSPLANAVPASAANASMAVNVEWLQMGYQQPDVRPVDFDGDGRGDLLVKTGFVSWKAYVSIATSTSGPLFEYIGEISPAPGGDPSVHFGDVNGDGLTDVIPVNFVSGGGMQGSTITGYVYISKGNGFEAPVAFAPSSRNINIVDVNNDGRDDLVVDYVAFLSIGSEFAYQSTNLGITGLGRGNDVCVGYDSWIRFADLNADGQKDVVGTWIPGNQTCLQLPVQQVYKASLKGGPRPDLVTALTNPMGASFTANYKALGLAAIESNPIYTVTATPTAPVTRVVRNGQHVVTSYTQSDGVGGVATISYQYRNGLRNMRGRGWLGFDKVTVSDSRVKAPDVVTYYRQDFPFIGFVQQRDTLKQGTSTLLQRYAASYEQHTAAQWRFPHLYEETTTDYSVVGSAVRVTQRNLHGNVASSDWNYTHGAPRFDVTAVGTPGAASSEFWTTTLEFTYDAGPVANNCLAVPARVDTTAAGPAVVASTRSVQYSNLAQTCVPYKITEGGVSLPAEQLVTNLYYDNFGNVQEEMTHAGSGPGNHQRRTFYVFGSEPDVIGSGYRLTRLSKRQSEETVSACTGTIAAVDLHTDFTWDPRFGLEKSVLLPTADRTDQQYDGFGRPILVNPSAQSATDTAESATAYLSCAQGCDFTAHGQYRVVTTEATGSGQSAVTTTVVDRLGRPVGVATTLLGGAVSRVATTYNALGQVVAETVPYTGSTAPGTKSMAYDDLGRVVTASRPVTVNGVATEAVTTFEYSGLTVTTTDPSQHATQRTSFANGLLASVVDARAGETTYEYNGFGQLARVNYVGGGARIMAYNSRGFMTSQSDPNSGAWTFGYTPYGEVQTVTDARNNFVSTAYDMLGRPVGRTDYACTAPGNCSAELSTTFGYHGDGQLASVSTGSFLTEMYTYADRGKPTAITTILYGTTYSTDIAYDTYGRVKTKTYPSIPTVGRYRYENTYDHGYLKSVREDVGLGYSDVYTVLETNAAGQVTKSRFGGAGGVVEEQLRDPRDFRLSAIRTGPVSNPTQYQDLTYGWAAHGTLDWRRDLKQGSAGGLLEEFEYDELDRLTAVRLAGVTTQTMSYTASGNLATKSDVGTYYYGQDGAFPHAVTSIVGSPNRAYHYDANGRMDCRGAATATCTGGNRIEWFVGGGVREVNNGPLKSVFTYGGPDRRRVRQTVSHASLPNAAQNRTITYVGAHFEVETEQATGKTRYRLSAFAGGRAVYQRVETIVSNAAQAPEAYYLHRDHLGSVDKLSPAISGGSGVTAYSFDAFGGRRGTNWQADSTTYGQNHWTDRGYTGHEHLDDVELIHMNGRVQHPGLGRFLSPDPLLGDPANPQTLNRYAYVSNNPLALVDPSGFCEAPVDADGGRCGEVVVTATRVDGFGSRGGGISYEAPPPAGTGATADPTLRDISGAGLAHVGGLTASALEGLSLANIKGLIEKQVALDLIRDLRKAANPAAFRNNLTREGKRLLEMGRAMIREAEGKNVSAKLAAAQRSLAADVALVKSVARGAGAVGPLTTYAEVMTGNKTPAEGRVDYGVYAVTGVVGVANGWLGIGLGVAYGIADMAGYGDPFRSAVIHYVDNAPEAYGVGVQMQSFGCPPLCTMAGGY